MVKNNQYFDGIIFDLDGTLWDASATCARAWNATLEQAGIIGHKVDEAAIRSFSGMQIEKVFSQQFGFIPVEQHPELLASYKINEQRFMADSGGELFPAARQVLSDLKVGYPLFIVSNCLDGYIENFVQFTGLQNIFADFESSGHTGLTKAENISLIMDRNKLANPIYIGDTTWDLEAAEKAGIPFIHAAYGFGKFQHGRLSIAGLEDLPPLLQIQSSSSPT